MQRIAFGYIVAAVCEIWFSNSLRNAGHIGVFFRNYFIHWLFLVSLAGIYLGLLYGLYVPDWQFEVQQSVLSNVYRNDTYIIKKVKCGVRGDLGPACNSVGMIDRYVLGIEHLYKKSFYRNLKVCQNTEGGDFSDNSASWCQAPFDPEGILGSLMAAVTCILGLQYGHILVHLEEHKDRFKLWLQLSVSIFSFGLFLNLIGDPLNKQLYTISYALLTTGSAGLTFCALYFLEHKDRFKLWLQLSVSIFSFGLFLNLIGDPLNKQLYTISYALLTTGSAGLTFCALYFLVDVGEHRGLTCILEWMGRHSLSIFILVPSNLAVIVLQGFYWRNPNNNIVHWVLSILVHK
ncbi:uncharacterized protein LOC110021061 [Phalaenopsis equestris]|uniref:uncharacterized protein LOC110021061 n=1 Tax=Phalaenopsis equestris TaxID=78828 RepID=UPI0009E3D3B7|nr:uncharacterized protein LOC110021061 [Phalaenopsis equestris]